MPTRLHQQADAFSLEVDCPPLAEPAAKLQPVSAANHAAPDQIAVTQRGLRHVDPPARGLESYTGGIGRRLLPGAWRVRHQVAQAKARPPSDTHGRSFTLITRARSAYPAGLSSLS
jgi:hypothetical protein